MTNLRKISEFLDGVNRRMGEVIAWLTVPLVAMVVVDTVARRLFHVTLIGVRESVGYIIVLLFFACNGYTYLHNTHLRIILVSAGFSRRFQAWIELFGCVVLLIPACIIVIYYGSLFVFGLVPTPVPTSGWIPDGVVIRASLPVGFLLLLLQGISVSIRQIIFLKDDASTTKHGMDVFS